MVNINQRGVTIAAAVVGAYGPDRWKKVDATNMTQVVEDLNFTPGMKYTLSWKGGTPQVLTAPGTGHWTLPNIPITATEIQLELGEVATPFERRSYGQELALCQRYFQLAGNGCSGFAETSSVIGFVEKFSMPFRSFPTITWKTGATATWRIGDGDNSNGNSASLANITPTKEAVWAQQTGFSGLTVNQPVSSRNVLGDTGLFMSCSAEL
jgi:hypothetical protein